MKKELLETLKKYWNHSSFRENQESAIIDLLEKKDIMYIAKTGDGKSICYQMPAILSDGTTIIISPLKSLMKNQVENLQSKGISATFINSDLTPEESRERLSNLINGKYKMLYVSPEKISNSWFFDAVLSIKGGISYFIVDEFDTIDEYGSSGFRPEYLELGKIKKSIEEKLGKKIPIGVFTATATAKFQKIATEMLNMKTPVKYIGDLIGENIKIDINFFEKKAEKDSTLFNIVSEIDKKKNGITIIFCSTVKNVESIYTLLGDKGFKVGKYHGQLITSKKDSNFKKFMEDKIDFMICTNAFGRGIDKPNIRKVIHYGIPGNISSYIQEIGRAGRDGNESNAIMLYDSSDIAVRKFLINGNKEKQENFEELLNVIENGDCIIDSVREIFGHKKENKKCNQCFICNDGNYFEYKEKENNFKVVKKKREVSKKKKTSSKTKTSSKKKKVTKKSSKK